MYDYISPTFQLAVGILQGLIRAFSDFKAFLYILIGGFSVAKAANQNIYKGFKAREGSDYAGFTDKLHFVQYVH